MKSVISFSQVSLRAGALAVALALGSTNVVAAETRSTAPMFPLVKADQIIGHDVRSTTGQDLGEVEDLVVDHQGHIVYALVSTGGILGVGNLMHAVPYGSFTSTEVGPGKALAVDLKGADWNRAPVVRLDQRDTFLDEDRGRAIHRYFQQDWRTERRRGDRDAVRWLLVSELDDQKVMHNGQAVGEVEDVLVRGDRVYPVIEPASGTPGAGHRYAVALDQLSWTAPGTTVATISLPPDAYTRARPFPEGLGELDSSLAYLVDSHTTRPGGLAPIVDNSAEPVSTSERASVAAVRKALHQDPALASAMRRVEVSRDADQLRLTGRVISRDIKERIERRTEALAKGWKVQNEIEVGELPAE